MFAPKRNLWLSATTTGEHDVGMHGTGLCPPAAHTSQGEAASGLKRPSWLSDARAWLDCRKVRWAGSLPWAARLPRKSTACRGGGGARGWSTAGGAAAAGSLVRGGGMVRSREGVGAQREGQRQRFGQSCCTWLVVRQIRALVYS